MPSLASLLTVAAADQPLIHGPAIDAFKDFVNWLSVPEFSLPIFTLLFVLSLVLYKWWTKPVVFASLVTLFCIFYFGGMLIDSNYMLILQKPDNVPITIMLGGLIFCLWLAFKQAATNDERLAAGKPLIEEDKDERVLTWPDLVYTEMLCMVIATVALIGWSVLLRAPLESPANPAGPPNPSKAPWYFLGLQEMLVYFDPWMAGVVLPTMIITGLLAMPYIDTNPKGNGYYTFAERKFAISTWLFGFVILWVVLIVFGTFLRGPNWNFFGPFEYWDSHLQVPLTNWNLSDFFWLSLLNKPLPANPIYREIVGIILVAIWVLVLPVALTLIPMFARLRSQMGAWRFYLMAIHLIIMAMLPVKMVLRWLITLKYFVYLPEFNLNL